MPGFRCELPDRLAALRSCGCILTMVVTKNHAYEVHRSLGFFLPVIARLSSFYLMKDLLANRVRWASAGRTANRSNLLERG
jgi:hypothetical protein